MKLERNDDSRRGGHDSLNAPDVKLPGHLTAVIMRLVCRSAKSWGCCVVQGQCVHSRSGARCGSDLLEAALLVERGRSRSFQVLSAGLDRFEQLRHLGLIQ